MKSVHLTKTLLLIPILFFFMLTCSGQDNAVTSLVGKWVKTTDEVSASFVISSDNKWEVEFTGDDETDVYGSCVISGTKITFNDEGGQYSSEEPGVYEFKVSATSLTFTQVNDPVYGRSMLVAGTWTKADATLKE